MSKAKGWDPQAASKPFGGINLIITGDIGQLPPVNAASLFSHTLVTQLKANTGQTPIGQGALNGTFLWRQINKVVILKKNIKAEGDQPFINMLTRIRKGCAWNGVSSDKSLLDNKNNYEVSDYETLLSRRLPILAKSDPKHVEEFSTAPIVVGERILRDALNDKIVQNFASSTNQQLHWYHADDRYNKAPLQDTLRKRMLRVPSNVTDDAIGMLPLVPGMKVMVTDNVAMHGGVTNGCQGTVNDIKYEINDYGERRAICAYVHIPGCRIHAPGLPSDIIPILPERTTFKYKLHSGVIYYISRCQLPIIPAYVFTANKIQGQSLKKAIVDLKSAKSSQALYVMVSRAISLNNLAILRWFPSTHVEKRLSPSFRNEFQRLDQLDETTKRNFALRKWQMNVTK
jgi:ATP-dependent DNA helicase PIF1